MGKVLNEYYSSAFTVEKDMMTGGLRTINGDILRTVHIMVKEVVEAPRCMKVDTFPGPISSIRGHQEAREEITGSLAKICKSLDTGEVP